RGAVEFGRRDLECRVSPKKVSPAIGLPLEALKALRFQRVARTDTPMAGLAANIQVDEGDRTSHHCTQTAYATSPATHIEMRKQVWGREFRGVELSLRTEGEVCAEKRRSPRSLRNCRGTSGGATYWDSERR